MARRSRIGWITTVSILLLAATAQADLKPRRFDIADAPGAPNQLLITVDTTNLPVNVLLENVHIMVGFYDDGKRHVSTIDIPIGLLKGGAVVNMLKDYPPPPPSVTWMKGEQLSVFGHARVEGGKSDTLYPTIESSSGFVSIGRPHGDVLAPTKLATPTQLAPRDGTVFANPTFKPTFQWPNVSGAASYSVEVDCFHCCLEGKWCSEVGGNTTVINNIPANRITYRDTNPQPYRWRVWAVGSDGGTSPKSRWAGFSYR
jgi:hypothetical protein